MGRKTAVVLVAGLLAFLAFAAWFDITGHGVESPEPTPAATAAATDEPAAAPPDATPPPASANKAVEANRSERRGPSWSPADLKGKDGQPLTMGNAIPGAFEPIRVGTTIQQAVDAGFMQRDTQREESCEGTHWKWKGPWAEGLDVLVGADKKISSLGMSKDGLETPEGISIGNSYAAVDRTYGARLEGPVRMDYGQAGVFLRNGDNWIGFGFDNEPGRLADNSRVVFIEVSRGNRPGLLRDGC